MLIRVLDIFFALLGLIVLGIFMLGATVINLCTGEHKVLYKQKRVGIHKKEFDLLKFATMLENSPNMKGGLVTAVDDPRVLPFGKFLRRTKVNELPQLFNILKGEMSFVGPRPLAKEHFELYSEEQQQIISNIKPGLTGVASLFYRNQEQILADCGEDPIEFHDSVLTPYKGELEKWYAHNSSLVLYLLIIYLTAASIINRNIVTIKYFKNLPKPPVKLVNMLDEDTKKLFQG